MAKSFAKYPFLGKVGIILLQIIVLYLGFILINIVTQLPINLLTNLDLENVLLIILLILGVFGFGILKLFLYIWFAQLYALNTVTGKSFFLVISAITVSVILISMTITINLSKELASYGFSSYGSGISISTIFELICIGFFIKTGLDTYEER